MTEATETSETGAADAPGPQALMIDHLRNLLGDMLADGQLIRGRSSCAPISPRSSQR